jgi:hypothetical protein
MADYRELLRRAIDALPENNGTARRAVYEKARSALVTQLHAIEPSIPAREITQHRLTLEDCIRQVEQEATEKLLQGLSHREQDAELEEAVETPSMPEEASSTANEEPPAAEEVVEEVSPEDVPVEEASEAASGEPESDTDVDIEQEQQAEAVQPDAQAEAEVAHEADDIVEAPEVDAGDDSFEQAPIEDDFDAAAAEEETVEVVDETVEPEPEIETEVEPDETEKDLPTEAPISSEVDDPSDDQDESASEDLDTESSEADEDDAASDEDADLAAHNSLVEHLEEISEGEPNYNPSSVDDVIAQARAASGMEAPTPNLDAPEDKPANTNVEEALSSVREVEIEPEDIARSDEDDDDAQAAIDRALMALDREAEGEKDGDEDGTLMEESSKGAIAAATKGEPEMVEDQAEFVEDEQSGGGGGLLIFLGVFVLLLGLLGGGTYWAWREGFVNLDPVLEQVGLSDFIVNSPSDEGNAGDQTPATTATDTPPETNVRDVTQSNDDAANISETPAMDEGARLAPETDSVEASTTEPSTDDTAADTATETPADATDVATANEPDVNAAGDAPEAGADDARLPSEDENATPDESVENPLNVEDPTAQATPGAQSLLIEEQSSGSGAAVPFSGQTQWSRDVDELGLPTIRATASIPARNLSVDVLIRKNSDEALPASHLIEVNFSVTESFLGGSIASLPGVLMKDQELAQGTTLVGASVRIIDNSFLFAMSGAETDVARNLELLGQNGWLDLPLIYGTGRKAILTLEKGTAGTELFEEVLAEWAEN